MEFLNRIEKHSLSSQQSLGRIDDSSLRLNTQSNTEYHQEEKVPILIIDVKMKNSEKKKIYVFDGDTASELASKFSMENSTKS